MTLQEIKPETHQIRGRIINHKTTSFDENRKTSTICFYFKRV